MANFAEFEDAVNKASEEHAILDFTLGRDVGLGTFGSSGTSIVGAGVRIAQFTSNSSMSLGADPLYNFAVNPQQKYHDVYEFDTQENRSFHGIGPELTWDATHPLWGETEDGEITLDWGINFSVLFGTDKAQLSHNVRHCRLSGSGTLNRCDGEVEIVEPADDVDRDHTVIVPNVGGYLGASMRYHNSKLSLGYRVDTFFNAMDGGQETAKSYNRGFYGPYLNVSLGL